MRAPAPSFSPMNGAPTFAAMSMTLCTFSANTSPRAPPKTVKSCAKRNTLRPSIVPQPVMTPSVNGFSSSSGLRLRASRSSSTKLPSSSRYSTRSPRRHLAAVVLPLDGTLRPRVVRLLLALLELFPALAQRMVHRTLRLQGGRGACLRVPRRDREGRRGDGLVVPRRRQRGGERRRLEVERAGRLRGSWCRTRRSPRWGRCTRWPARRGARWRRRRRRRRCTASPAACCRRGSSASG